MKKVVFDTNVIISAYKGHGFPRDCYYLARTNRIKLHYSEPILDEVKRVLAYLKFNFTNEEIKVITSDFVNYAKHVKIQSEIHIIKEDRSDNMFLECAIDARADFIISGDNHLLKLKNYRGIFIVSPKEFIMQNL